MSLYGTMRTGVSGMNAQSNRLSTVAENIANANTTGYKRASTEFSSMILPSGNGSYNSGGVQTEVRYSISQQGATTFTTSASDLAIDGGGFFIVEGANGQEYLTRAGSFVPDSEGNLVNASGFTLMGYEYEAGVDPTVVVNGFDGLTRVNLASGGLIAAGSTKGSMGANLPSGAPVGDVSTTSLVVYDSQGNTRILDFNYEKTGANAWTLEIVDRASGDALTVPPVTLAFNAAGELTTSPATVVANGALIVPPSGDWRRRRFNHDRLLQDHPARLRLQRRRGQHRRQRAEQGCRLPDRLRRHRLCQIRERQARSALSHRPRQCPEPGQAEAGIG